MISQHRRHGTKGEAECADLACKRAVGALPKHRSGFAEPDFRLPRLPLRLNLARLWQRCSSERLER
eukprot:227093-Rhodomonas_salina.1